MPGVEGTYPVYLDVFVAGQLIGAYRADEDVVIAPVEIKGISPDVATLVRLPNHSSAAQTKPAGLTGRVAMATFPSFGENSGIIKLLKKKSPGYCGWSDPGDNDSLISYESQH